MDNLARLIQQTMRRRHLTAQAIAEQTGIRTPRVKAFAEDGANGPIHPTDDELRELARSLALPLSAVLGVAHPSVKAKAASEARRLRQHAGGRRTPVHGSH
ncbi:XRE family transcriptional regulator [Streptomyces incarnatus]|uniref:XRE family transcriptional regulator n=1 Tax=Streptomyces incarnatus TaxID=665007 RepID=UPI000AC635C9|nr:XRE family transcriptional regulator [Streptomyces incarnatus]